jgi:hypothetical protein
MGLSPRAGTRLVGNGDEPMKIALWLIGVIVLTLSYPRAESVSATCTLEVNGKKIWDGKCCIEQSPIDEGAGGSLVELSARSAGICVYKNTPEQDDLPTS